jgi:hypothetical protein
VRGCNLNGMDSRTVKISGVTTAARLRAAGLSAGQIQRLTGRGTLRSLRTGVYAPAALADSVVGDQAAAHLLQVAAAIAVSRSRVVGSHRSAAIVHGLSLIGPRLPGRVELTRTPGDQGSRSRRPGILLHVAALPAAHVIRCRAVPVTSVAPRSAAAERGANETGQLSLVPADWRSSQARATRADMPASPALPKARGS